jgi:phospholipid-binding lipoprotein MlaA
VRVWSKCGVYLLAVTALQAVGGCATVPAAAGSNPADPYERLNRHVYAFNDGFDRAIARPVARGYTAIIPRPARVCISNIFYNVGEVGNAVNSALQGRPLEVASDVGRLAVNSTAGVLGCFDVARRLGWERNRQYFGLTMGKWGLTPGPYLVLPFLGPSTVRDAVGEVPDYFTDPASYIVSVKTAYAVYGVHFIDKRAQYLDATNLVDDAALDPYAFVRDAYLQRQRSRVYDGAPPPLPEEDPDSPPADAPGAGKSDPAPALPAPAH